VQGVVQGLGGRKKGRGPGDHFPRGRDSELVQQGNEILQDLGHAAALAGGIDHDHAQPAQGLAQAPEELVIGLADQFPVISQ
jgi:hypothetical protein